MAGRRLWVLPAGRARLKRSLAPPVRARHLRIGAYVSSPTRQVSAPIKAHASELLKSVILPSCQWRAGRVAQAVRTLNGDTDPLPVLPDDAAQVAWSIGAMIDLDLNNRYRLLAERSPAARLTQIDHVLRKAIPDLELQAALKAK